MSFTWLFLNIKIKSSSTGLFLTVDLVVTCFWYPHKNAVFGILKASHFPLKASTELNILYWNVRTDCIFGTGLLVLTEHFVLEYSY